MPTCPKATTSAPENAEESGNLDCIDEDDNGSDYAGKVTVTVTGATCNKWSDADLGNWAYGSMGEYKKLPGNFCRNPDNSKLPWCFVAGTKDSYYQGAEGRAFCDVPACPADPSAPTCREFLTFFHFSFHLFSTCREFLDFFISHFIYFQRAGSFYFSNFSHFIYFQRVGSGARARAATTKAQSP